MTPESPEFTRTHWFMSLSAGQVAAFRELTGRVNDRPVFGQPAGRVLYVGTDGRLGDEGGWVVTHRFRLNDHPVLADSYPPADFSPLFGGNPPAE